MLVEKMLVGPGEDPLPSFTDPGYINAVEAKLAAVKPVWDIRTKKFQPIVNTKSLQRTLTGAPDVDVADWLQRNWVLVAAVALLLCWYLWSSQQGRGQGDPWSGHSRTTRRTFR